jgi:MFS family permease
MAHQPVRGACQIRDLSQPDRVEATLRKEATGRAHDALAGCLGLSLGTATCCALHDSLMPHYELVIQRGDALVDDLGGLMLMLSMWIASTRRQQSRATAAGPRLHRYLMVNKQSRFLTFVVLSTPLFLAALEQTIVTTASPTLARELALPRGGYSWIVNMYLLASIMLLPLWGRIADKTAVCNVYPAALGAFMGGSVICGFANDMTAFLIGRFIQGVGSAGISVCSYAGVARYVPRLERPFYIGLLSAVYAVSSIVGPPAGGLVTELASWRWIFYINVPFGLLFVATTLIYLRRLPVEVAPKAPPSSVSEARQHRGRSPSMYADFVLSFLAGGVFLAPIVYLPLFLVESSGVSVLEAGNRLIPVTLAAVAGSVVGGKIQSRYPGSALNVLSLSFLGQVIAVLVLFKAEGMSQIIIGTSILMLFGGWAMPLISTRIQDASDSTNLAANTSMMTLTRMLGGGVAVWLVGATARFQSREIAVETRLWATCLFLLFFGVVGLIFLRARARKQTSTAR